MSVCWGGGGASGQEAGAHHAKGCGPIKLGEGLHHAGGRGASCRGRGRIMLGAGAHHAGGRAGVASCGGRGEHHAGGGGATFFSFSLFLLILCWFFGLFFSLVLFLALCSLSFSPHYTKEICPTVIWLSQLFFFSDEKHNTIFFYET